MTLQEEMLNAIDSRSLRNFDRDAFQSFDAKEIETIAASCTKIAEDFAEKFAEWVNAKAWNRLYPTSDNRSPVQWYNFNLPSGERFRNINIKTTKQLIQKYKEESK